MRNAVIIFTLLFFISLGYWFLRGFSDNGNLGEADEKVEKVFIAYDVKANYYSEQGHLLYQVDSKEVTEFSKDHGTVFTTPLVKSYSPERTLEWQGSSQTAELSADKDSVTLLDDVYILQSPNTDKQIQLTGQELRYNALTDMIFSNQPVMISDGLISQKSNDFSLNIKTDKIKFGNGVEANYQNDNDNDKTK